MYNRRPLVNKETRRSLQSSERLCRFFYLGVLDRANLRQSHVPTLYFSTIAANFCAVQNLLPEFKLNLSR